MLSVQSSPVQFVVQLNTQSTITFLILVVFKTRQQSTPFIQVLDVLPVEWTYQMSLYYCSVIKLQ